MKTDLPQRYEDPEGHIEYKFKTAEHFYEVLSKFNDTIDEQGKWIFRGHWDSDWEFIPGIFRGEWQDKFLLEPLKWVPSTPTIRKPQSANSKKIDFGKETKDNGQFKYQIMIEQDLLEQFMSTANLLEIKCNHIKPIYKYEKIIKDASLQNDMETLEKWPDARVLPIMSLAQHHGVPTRLLDFTKDPLFAAFFAASNPFFEEYITKNKEFKKDANLCIWAINKKTLTAPPWQMIDKTSRFSKNLFAQKSVLVLDKQANQKFKRNEAWWDFKKMGTPDNFIKFTLPQSKYKELLCLLWDNDMTPAKIMPNLDKVTQTMEYIQWLWAKPQNLTHNSLP